MPLRYPDGAKRRFTIMAASFASSALRSISRQGSRRLGFSTDPGEQKDLAGEHPAKKAELAALFEKWNASMQPPRWEDPRWNGDPNRKVDKKKRKKDP